MALFCIEIPDNLLAFGPGKIPRFREELLPPGPEIRTIFSTFAIAVSDSIYYIRQGSIYAIKDTYAHALQEPKADDQE